MVFAPFKQFSFTRGRKLDTSQFLCKNRVTLWSLTNLAENASFRRGFIFNVIKIEQLGIQIN
jgi:hypothetical protein